MNTLFLCDHKRRSSYHGLSADQINHFFISSRKYFDRVIYPDLQAHTESWIIVKWGDANNDTFVDGPGEGDTYTVIAEG